MGQKDCKYDMKPIDRVSGRKDKEDGDDPKDTRGPESFGEEIEYNPRIPPVYIVSDFHIGSNRGRKKRSNDMDRQTLRDFLEWLTWVEVDLPKDYDYYHVVMDGDFLDLWQANIPEKQNNPMHDTMTTNTDFFDGLVNVLNNNTRMRFIYVIGNHDDPFITFDTTPQNALFSADENKVAGFGQVFRNRIVVRLKGDDARTRFKMNTYFVRDDLKMHVEHGHFHDQSNYKKDRKRSGGQNIAEQINKMQERMSSFRNLEYVPNAEMYKYLHCLYNIPPHMVDYPQTSKREKRMIERLKKISLEHHESGTWETIETALELILLKTSVDEEIEKAVSVKKMKRDAREASEDIQDNAKAKIVVLGHTHIWDMMGGGDWVYANTGTWLKKIRYRRDYWKGCQLETEPSDYPFVRIYAATKGNGSKAVVELISHREKKLLAPKQEVDL